MLQLNHMMQPNRMTEPHFRVPNLGPGCTRCPNSRGQCFCRCRCRRGGSRRRQTATSVKAARTYNATTTFLRGDSLLRDHHEVKQDHIPKSRELTADCPPVDPAAMLAVARCLQQCWQWTLQQCWQCLAAFSGAGRGSLPSAAQARANHACISLGTAIALL